MQAFLLIFQNISHLSSLQQKNSSYAASRHRIMHSTSTNILGSQILIRTPTAIQNKAKPANPFHKGNRPFRKASSFYAYSLPAAVQNPDSYFFSSSASSRISFRSSSDILPFPFAVKRSSTSGTMSRELGDGILVLDIHQSRGAVLDDKDSALESSCRPGLPPPSPSSHRSCPPLKAPAPTAKDTSTRGRMMGVIDMDGVPHYCPGRDDRIHSVKQRLHSPLKLLSAIFVNLLYFYAFARNNPRISR